MYLTAQHFFVAGRQKKTLNINVPGNILVFFKMQNCKGCIAFEPVFQQLVQSDNRVKYAIADISQFRDIVKMSYDTSTPIKAVPFILLYSEGRPLARFTGNRNVPSIRSFIEKALQSMPPQQSFVQQPQAPRASQPEYSQTMPQIGPSQAHTAGLKGRNAAPQLGPEDEDDRILASPNDLIPHNTPWENSRYKKMD